MGCDIHIYLEKNVEGNWHCIDYFKLSPYTNEYRVVPVVYERDYQLFALLAGVENRYEVEPIAPPKGLPENISSVVEHEFQIWKGDAHDCSWLSVKELFTYKDNVKNASLDCSCASFDKMISNIKERMCKELWIWDFIGDHERENRLRHDAKNFRIVFWFDG